ncbi:MAG: TetR/AcrR family transcriptional regulator [Burkholderiales bacterium]
MPRGPSSAHSLQRDTILNISADTFAELGYPSATMAQLAQRCGVSKSLLYHYYTSKDAILYDLMQAYMSRLQSLVIEVASRDLPAREALAETIRRFVREYESSRSRHIVLLNDVKYLPEPDRERIIAMERSVVQAMADLISKTYQIDEGRAKVLTMSVFGIVNWTFTWLKPGGSLTYPQYAEAVVGILEGGLNGGAERMQHIPIRKSKPPAGKQDV